MTPHNRALLADLLNPTSTRCTPDLLALLIAMRDEIDDLTLQLLKD